MSGADHMIPVRQNDADGLRLLRAKSARYDQARVVWRWQVGASVLVPAVLAGLQMRYPGWAPYGAAYGWLAAVADSLLLDRAKERFTAEGARAQELFDGRLFGLEWEANRGTAPGADDVERWARTHPSTAGLRTWYPPEVGVLPSWAAALVCIAVNGGWDRALRERYASAVLGVLLAAGGLLLLGASVANASVNGILLAASTVLPLVSWAIKDWRQQRKMAEGRARVRERADAAWATALRAVAEVRPVEAVARREIEALQYELFMLRRDSPPVLDWFYRRWRPEDEQAMRALAEARVREYEEAVAASRRPPAASLGRQRSSAPDRTVAGS